MTNKRKVEIFSAGCPCCEDTVNLVRNIACCDCEVTVLDMKDEAVAQRAKALGIHRVPAVVVNDQLLDCCQVAAPSEASLRAAGIGQPV